MTTQEYQDYQDYIDNALKSINFFLNCHQWSGLKKTDVYKWLSNFRDRTIIQEYYVLRIINNLLYYSETDLDILLKEGIINQLLTQYVLFNKQIPSGFELGQQTLQYELKEELRKSLFVPLLDVDAPYESGNQIARILVQQLGISESQVIFSDKLSMVDANKFSRLIIVDDCLGSGDQCLNFWTQTEVQDETQSSILLRDWCLKSNITAYYVVLTGYQVNIDRLSTLIPDLNIYCVEKLNDEHRVFMFNEKSIYWKSEEEMHNAKKYFEDITCQCGISLKGHSELDFALIMHRNIPDWSLKIFWRGSPNWNILMRRKNSYDLKSRPNYTYTGSLTAKAL